MCRKALYIVDSGLFNEYPTVTSVSIAAFVSVVFFSKLFLNRINVQFLYNKICMLSKVVAMAEVGTKTSGSII